MRGLSCKFYIHLVIVVIAGVAPPISWLNSELSVLGLVNNFLTFCL